MAKKSRATFQKREKERTRQQKQKDKAQRRLAAKERRAASGPRIAGEEADIGGMRPGPQALPEQWEYAKPTS
jgi:hypothetical protein